MNIHNSLKMIIYKTIFENIPQLII